MKLVRYIHRLFGMLFLVVLPLNALAEDSVTELAKKSQNPLEDMVSVPFQNNTSFGVGPDSEPLNVLNIQPIFPINLNENWGLITRTIIPVISKPVPPQNRINGLGDIQFTAWASPHKPTENGWIWGVGLITQLDTATDDNLGDGVWGLGPTAVVLKSQGQWLYGGLINNVWSVVNNGNPDVNKMVIQPFVNYNIPGKPGRYLVSSPIITADWETASGDVWTVPIGMGIGQVVKTARFPISFSAHAYYNVVRPQFGAEWQLRLQATLMFVKK